jgi:hypothetical protein
LNGVAVTAAVEGDTDIPIVQRLLEVVGLDLGGVFGLSGKDLLDRRINGYNNAARFSPWIVLRDLNSDAPCPSGLLGALLPEPAHFMCLRLAVHATEAWLLADRERAAQFLAVPLSRIPVDLDAVENPKRFLVELARRSRRSTVRADILPLPGTSARVGPGYTTRLIDFASNAWRPAIAAKQSRSLSRSLAALRRWREERVLPWVRGNA